MRQIAERLAARGHDVTVATSRHHRRKSKVVNCVKIHAFNAGGKMVYGLNGQIEHYREFVRTFEAHALERADFSSSPCRHRSMLPIGPI
jgi:NAD(P)-dependent dehydrogenase (short-subunit alcohol dehydrogenase family)